MIYIGGAGPGNPSYLTGEVLEMIKETEIVLAFGRISKTLASIREDIIAVSRVDAIVDIIEKNQDKDLLILASGDPNFYGIVNFIKSKGVKVDRILPGLSSFQYLMAKLNMHWHDAHLLSLHGRDTSLETVRDHRKSIILTDKDNTPDYISKELYKLGVRGTLIAGYNLSYEEEKIIEIKIGEEIKEASPLAIVVIINEMD